MKNDKKPVPPPTEPAQLPVSPPRAAGSVEVPYDYGDDVGRGSTEMAGEQRAPILLLLQNNSPQCEPGAKNVPGAKGGMFFNAKTGELIDGTAGMLFVPAAFRRMVVDYRDRNMGGGWLASHNFDKELMKQGRQKGNKIGTRVLPGGIERVDTRYLIGFRVADKETCAPSELLVLAFSSSKMGPFSTWTNRYYQLKGPPPLWANVVHVTSLGTTNPKNQKFYYNQMITPAVDGDYVKSLLPPANEGYQAGKKLDEQITQGLVNVLFESGAEDEADDEGVVTDPANTPKAPF